MSTHTLLAVFADPVTARRVERGLAEASFAHRRTVLAPHPDPLPDGDVLGSDSRVVHDGFDAALTEAGVPEDRVSAYAEGVREGGALIVLSGLDTSEAETAAEALCQYRPADPARRLAMLAAHGHAGYAPVANPFPEDEEETEEPPRFADDHPAEEVAVVYVM